VFFRPYARLPPPAPADPPVRSRRIRVGCRLAFSALAAAYGPLPPAVEAEARYAPPPAVLTSGNIGIVPAALTFTVSVCLDDFEYSIACRERSSLEAARRLEQIYLDDYATGNPAGSLRIWFAVKAEPSEQTNFLREVENRAAEAVFRKLREAAAHRMAATAAASAAPAGGTAESAREVAQAIQRWHDEAGVEARTGINWSHDWGARSHTYKPGQALRDLARIGNRNKQNAGRG
jgi:hypothetical protein